MSTPFRIANTVRSRATLNISPFLNKRMVHSVTSAQEFNSAISQGKVLVDFYATWCGPCKMISPLLEKLEPQFPDIKFLKLDTEEVPEIASQFTVSNVPTFLFFKDGQQIDVVKGAAPAKLKASIENLNN